MSVFYFLILMGATQVVGYQELHLFVNRYQANRTAYIMLTLETLEDNFFTTKVMVDKQRLVDFFQTNISEAREPMLWHRTANLVETLDFYGIFTTDDIPYVKCYYHVSRVDFFVNGYHFLSGTITANGLSTDETMALSYIYIDYDENVRCLPRFDIPRCHDSNRPLSYETSEVLVLHAVFSKRCPLDTFTKYYWTLHDSTGKRKLSTWRRQTSIAAYSQPDEQIIRITLYIRSAHDPLRTGVAIQSVVFMSSSLRRYIDISIDCVTNCIANKFSSMAPIHLKAVCLGCKKQKITLWKWTMDNAVIGTANRLILQTNKLKRRITINLFAEAIHRHKTNIEYQGKTSILLDKNQGPTDTYCNVNPLEGDALETLFIIQCETGIVRNMPLTYCIDIGGFPIEECKTDELLMVRLLPTSHVNIQICDSLDACTNVIVSVDVRHTDIDDSEATILNYLVRARYWLEYADWPKSFILLYQLSKKMDTKERLIVFTETLEVYKPQTSVQLSHIVRLAKQVVVSLEPLDDMKVNVLARMFHIIATTFESISWSNELTALIEEYQLTMVNDFCDLLNTFSAEWEFIPKSQCRAASSSCLNIDNFRHRLEQMSTLQPQGLEHINNWLHVHWKLSICLYYLGMGTARRLHPKEGVKTYERSSFTMRLESFDLDLEQPIVIESADYMHTLIFTDTLLQEFRRTLKDDAVLISVRSHKQSPYWWYPEQESRTQVLVVNIYTSNDLWEKTRELSEPFQYISRLKTNFAARRPNIKTSGSSSSRRRRQNAFDDPEDDVENFIHDNIINSKEVRMYRTELYGHSVLSLTFTQADINLRVLVHMTNVPKLEAIDSENGTCFVKAGITEPTIILLRNRCEEARPVYIYLKANDPSTQFDKSGEYFTFSTEVRSCRIWKYSRPEPNWQTSFCMPEMNKSVYFGIHCRCKYISDLDADSQPIIAVPMNLKCHLERTVVEINYRIIFCYVFFPLIAIAYLFIQMLRSIKWDKRLYVEDIQSGKLCHSGDIIGKLTFGGRYSSGTSANIIISLLSSRGELNIVIYQDPVHKTFLRNSTITFRLERRLVQLPVSLALGHDSSGIYPHYYCQSVIFSDIQTKQTQQFLVRRWVRESPLSRNYMTSQIFNTKHNTTNNECWRARFSHSIEVSIGNWYLFQPLFGPWRFGFSCKSLSRCERTSIWICKMFFSMCIVVTYFGRALPIACDPSPKRFNEFVAIGWLCLYCLFGGYIIEGIIILFLRLI
ncbi:hypothetical protein KR222_007998 [Zaprionus bogoriensis]|nr:hypothetical protein KR222_007998 [Zaprionus bogoriensis]